MQLSKSRTYDWEIRSDKLLELEGWQGQTLYDMTFANLLTQN